MRDDNEKMMKGHDREGRNPGRPLWSITESAKSHEPLRIPGVKNFGHLWDDPAGQGSWMD